MYVLMFQIFIREAYHICRDKLINTADKSVFDTVIEKVMNTYWGNIGSFHHGYYVCLETQSFKNLTWISRDDWINMIEKGIIQFSK